MVGASVGINSEIEVAVRNGWVRWDKVSLHPNYKATNAWGLHLTEVSDDYGTPDGDWLDTKDDGSDTKLDVSGLAAGDYIKVSGASHSNQRHAYYRVSKVTAPASGDGTLRLTRVEEADVVEAVTADDDDLADQLRRDLIELARTTDDAETLEAARDVLK